CDSEGEPRLASVRFSSLEKGASSTVSIYTTFSETESSPECAQFRRARTCTARFPYQSRRAEKFRTCEGPDTNRTLPRATRVRESVSANTPDHRRADRPRSPLRSPPRPARPRTAQAQASPDQASYRTP